MKRILLRSALLLLLAGAVGLALHQRGDTAAAADACAREAAAPAARSADVDATGDRVIVRSVERDELGEGLRVSHCGKDGQLVAQFNYRIQRAVDGRTYLALSDYSTRNADGGYATVHAYLVDVSQPSGAAAVYRAVSESAVTDELPDGSPVLRQSGNAFLSATALKVARGEPVDAHDLAGEQPTQSAIEEGK